MALLFSLEGSAELTLKFSGFAAGLVRDRFLSLGKGFPTTGPRVQAKTVVIHRGLHVSDCTEYLYACGLLVTVSMYQTLIWRWFMKFGRGRTVSPVLVGVQRGADRREAGRMREGHMDASSGKVGSLHDKCIAIQYLEAIRNLRNRDFIPVRTVHISYVPDEKIGGSDGATKFVQSKEFKELNVGFMMDEGQASLRDEFRVFYADKSPWSLIIKDKGTPCHGSRMYDNSAMENLMKSVEIISRFKESQFEIVKAGEATNSEVISVNSVFVNAGIPSPK
ncbi:putative Aminoacylase-1 [Cucumis melo var. makuwa]|uniref:Aminoacylase-1 n=1 Tax=Cucumis melo var. makuwa TaxID=1194695 RepID=A0A5A7V636_CUCMM|nr:putative Aminoacylase-1 [Cucumis melo var. makuwa]